MELIGWIEDDIVQNKLGVSVEVKEAKTPQKIVLPPIEKKKEVVTEIKKEEEEPPEKVEEAEEVEVKTRERRFVSEIWKSESSFRLDLEMLKPESEFFW